MEVGDEKLAGTSMDVKDEKPIGTGMGMEDEKLIGTGMDVKDEKLITAALEARERAYAPYSHFKVGAALLTAEGRIFTGCNIENASYGVTNCAERTALFKAVSEGYTHFSAIAVAGGPAGAEKLPFAWPCGICRQALAEFCGPDFRILTAGDGQKVRECTLAELLPHQFDSGALGGRGE